MSVIFACNPNFSAVRVRIVSMSLDFGRSSVRIQMLLTVFDISIGTKEYLPFETTIIAQSIFNEFLKVRRRSFGASRFTVIVAPRLKCTSSQPSGTT